MIIFRVGARVRIVKGAYTRAGEIGTIIVIFSGCANVLFDDGVVLGYLIDEGELELVTSN